MSLLPTSQTFACLDARTQWAEARTAGLSVDDEGGLVLDRVPSIDGAAVNLPAPYAPPLQGFAVSACGEQVFALPTARRLVLLDPSCGDQALALEEGSCPSEVSLGTLSALAIHGRRLHAADEAGGRVYLFALPGLTLSAVWSSGVGHPARLGTDGEGRLYVLDRQAGRLIRLDPHGRPDRGYAAASGSLTTALDLFVTADGTAFASVAGQAEILRFSPTGAPLASTTAPVELPGFRPGALAGDGQRLYAADRTSGTIAAYDLVAGTWLGALAGCRAPIAGLAADGGAHLYLRTGAGTECLRLEGRGARVARGRLEAGPFDAGEHRAWLRVHLQATLPTGTRARLETALAGSAQPAALVWTAGASLDVLVRPPAPPDRLPDPAARFLWIRVELESDDPTRTPRLWAIVAETPGEDPLAQLPAVYARTDAEGDGYLRTWLEGLGAEFGDHGHDIAALAARLDPAVAPIDHLPWLASWMALELPRHGGAGDAATEVARRLLLDAHRLYERRGTVAGLREMVRIYTGIDCEIFEDFRSRPLWALDSTARLGFETGLAAALPDGMVVPGPSRVVPALQGLASEMFLDDHLGASAELPGRGGDRCTPHQATPTRIDPDGTFPSFAVPAVPAGHPPLRAFSVLWSGLLRALYSELYTFSFAHDGGARVTIDGELVIDSWSDPGDGERRGSLPMKAGRWVSVRIEYWSANTAARAPRLSWNSRSQPKQPVPRQCLYAVDDDNVDPDADRHDGTPGPLVVGETVVGAQGPLVPEDFGAPLFAETAHAFTVRVQARDVRRPGALDAIRAVLDAEKPAHTEYHLCVVEPRFVVGRQSSVGVDAIVAPPEPPGRLGESELGVDARLGLAAGHDDGSLRVDETLRIGPDAILR